MFQLAEDVLKYSIILILEVANDNKEYDLVIDFNSYSMECAVNAIKTKAKKRIIWCHNDLVEKYKEESKYRVLWFFFHPKYKYFDKILI